MPSADPSAPTGATASAGARLPAGPDAGLGGESGSAHEPGRGVVSGAGGDADPGTDTGEGSGSGGFGVGIDDTGTVADADTEYVNTDVNADTEYVDTGVETDAGYTDADIENTDAEDTMDLRLPDELLALIAEEANEADGSGWGGEQAAATSYAPLTAPRAASRTPYEDLLDQVADWGPVSTSVGLFHLVTVSVERDLPLISRWMNDPAAAAFWQLSGSPSVAEDHVRAQLTGDGRSVPCVGVLDGTPMSYWEIYRADLDPLARHYPARPHDTGIHLLVGAVADRGRGLGNVLLRAVADLVLARRPFCARVIAEPDIRNTPSVAAFLTAGFRFSAEVDLPTKRAALMVRDRSLRHLL